MKKLKLIVKTVKLIVTDIDITYVVQYGRHNLHSHCIGSHFLISNLNISTLFTSLSSSGTIFHTSDAKYCKESKTK